MDIKNTNRLSLISPIPAQDLGALLAYAPKKVPWDCRAYMMCVSN